jgi:hypothetical protein
VHNISYSDGLTETLPGVRFFGVVFWGGHQKSRLCKGFCVWFSLGLQRSSDLRLGAGYLLVSTHLQKVTFGRGLDRSTWGFEVSSTDCIFDMFSANTFWVLTLEQWFLIFFCCHLNLNFDEISKDIPTSDRFWRPPDQTRSDVGISFDISSHFSFKDFKLLIGRIIILSAT